MEFKIYETETEFPQFYFVLEMLQRICTFDSLWQLEPNARPSISDRFSSISNSMHNRDYEYIYISQSIKSTSLALISLVATRFSLL